MDIIHYFDTELSSKLCWILAFGMLFLFYKATKLPNKNYGLLMVLILFVPLFVCSVLQIVILRFQFDDRFDWIYYILVRFASIWIVCLAIFHYFILKSFKAKYRKHPFKIYISLAAIASLIFAGIMNLEYFTTLRIDSLTLDLFSFLSLGAISLRAQSFRKEIKFGPYSVARESATKLIQFSSMEALFAFLSLTNDILRFLKQCPNQVDPDEENVFCAVLGFTDTVIYQGWVWWAIFYNWKMFSVQEEREYSSESISSDANTSGCSSVSLPLNS